MCYNNISMVGVCVLHSLLRTPLRNAPLLFHGTPRNCLTPQRLIFVFTALLLVLLDHLLCRYATEHSWVKEVCCWKAFVYVLQTLDCRAGNNKHISRTHMIQQSQQKMCHMFILPYLFYVSKWGSEREEGYVLIKKSSFLTVVNRPDHLQVYIFSAGLSKSSVIDMFWWQVNLTFGVYSIPLHVV